MYLRLVLFAVGVQVTLAVSGTPYQQQVSLTNEEKQKLLDSHNAFRAKVAKGEERSHPSASDMVALEWDDRLERKAQDWASQCQHGHNTAAERIEEPYPNVGQNYAGNYGVKESVQVWYDENKDYDFRTDGCADGRVCGHYEQLVWAMTEKIGCGYNACGDESELQCHYAEGLYIGMEDHGVLRPYKEGRPCTECPKGHSFCMAGALCASRSACDKSDNGCECDLDASQCQNGHFDDENCECVCDSDFEGMRCDVPCEDAIDWCDVNKNERGACAWDAREWMWMGFDCRKTCNKCPPIQDPRASDRGSIRVNVDMSAIIPDEVPEEGEPEGPCGDTNTKRNCDHWVASGLCEFNVAYMRENCGKSCGFC